MCAFSISAQFLFSGLGPKPPGELGSVIECRPDICHFAVYVIVSMLQS
jgi:hypothetical protein